MAKRSRSSWPETFEQARAAAYLISDYEQARREVRFGQRSGQSRVPHRNQASRPTARR